MENEENPKRLGAISRGSTVVLEIYEHGEFEIKITNAEEFRAAIDQTKSGQTIRIYVTSGARGSQGVSGYRFLRVP